MNSNKSTTNKFLTSAGALLMVGVLSACSLDENTLLNSGVFNPVPSATIRITNVLGNNSIQNAGPGGKFGSISLKIGSAVAHGALIGTSKIISANPTAAGESVSVPVGATHEIGFEIMGFGDLNTNKSPKTEGSSYAGSTKYTSTAGGTTFDNVVDGTMHDPVSIRAKNFVFEKDANYIIKVYVAYEGATGDTAKTVALRDMPTEGELVYNWIKAANTPSQYMVLLDAVKD